MSLHSSYKGDYVFKWKNYPYLKLSGLEPLVVTPESNFINVEAARQNNHGSPQMMTLSERLNRHSVSSASRTQANQGNLKSSSNASHI